jgi:pyochelin biosynthesis protein PchC
MSPDQATSSGGHFVDRDAWLRCRAVKPHALAKVVCLPHAGGSAGFFRDWSAPGVDVLGVQYPGRGDRIAEPCAASVSELARAIAAVICRTWAVVLFGHSLGAILAFEAASLLEHPYGATPVHLVVSGRKAPDELGSGVVHGLSDDELVEEIVRLGGADGVLLRDPDARSVFLPQICEDFRIADTYVHRAGPPLSCPVKAVIDADDTEVTPEQAQRWSHHTTGSFAQHVLLGGHFYLMPEKDSVLDIVTATLEMRDFENV